MSNVKAYQATLEEMKDSRSIYLTMSEWEYLASHSITKKNSPTWCIREMILEKSMENELRDKEHLV